MAIERTHEVTTEKGRPSTPTKEEWNRHCFQIVHTHHQNNESTPKTTTRIFTAPAEDRNEWVYVMNQALMSYEKRLSKAAKQQTKKARHGSLVLDNDGWTEGINHSGAGMRSLSPVCSAATLIGLPPAGRRGRMRSPSPIRSRSITPVQI